MYPNCQSMLFFRESYMRAIVTRIIGEHEENIRNYNRHLDAVNFTVRRIKCRWNSEGKPLVVDYAL